MRRLIPNARDERGVVAIMVAMSMVVLVGMAAFVLDFAQMYQERRELQNGADAGALAIADACRRNVVDCVSQKSSPTEATKYANANALDGLSNVDGVEILCLKGGNYVSSCATDDLVAGQVTVDTSTLQPGGVSKIFYTFAKVFSNAYDGETIAARAVARWGRPARMKSLPIAIDRCEYETGVANAVLNQSILLVFHDGNDGDDKKGTPPPCPVGPAGQDLPGGFGWLDPAKDQCAADVSTSGGATAKPGNPVPKNCNLSDFAIGRVVALPIYSSASDGGNNGKYTIVGFAGLRIDGYQLVTKSGGVESAYSPDAAPKCGAGDTCLRGVITEFFAADAFPNTGSSVGNVTAIALTD